MRKILVIAMFLLGQSTYADELSESKGLEVAKKMEEAAKDFKTD